MTRAPYDGCMSWLAALNINISLLDFEQSWVFAVYRRCYWKVLNGKALVWWYWMERFCFNRSKYFHQTCKKQNTIIDWCLIEPITSAIPEKRGRYGPFFLHTVQSTTQSTALRQPGWTCPFSSVAKLRFVSRILASLRSLSRLWCRPPRRGFLQPESFTPIRLSRSLHPLLLPSSSYCWSP